jgi:hypothetical protein
LPRPHRVPPLSVHPAFVETAKLTIKADIERLCHRERDQVRIAPIAIIRSVLERYRKDSDRYPVLPSGNAWGECAGSIPYNLLPDGNDYTWSWRYIHKIATDSRTVCYYRFDLKT